MAGLILLLSAGRTVLTGQELNVWRIETAARKAERKGDLALAYALYAQAALAEPGNPKWWARSQALRTQAALAEKSSLAPALSQAATKTDLPPDPAVVRLSGAQTNISDEDLAMVERMKAPPELAPAAGRRDVSIDGDDKALFEEMARGFGIEVIFDSEYTGAARHKLRLTQVDFGEALHAICTLTNSFAAPLGARLMLVARDTQQKRQEQERSVAVTIPLPAPVSVQEVQELARGVQQLFDIQKFAVDNGKRVVLVRDRVSKVRPAVNLFQQLLQHRAELSLEVEFYEVQSKRETSVGLNWDAVWNLAHLGRVSRSVFSDLPQGVTRFLTFGGGRTLFGLGVADAELFASMTHSVSTALLRAEMRSVDGQAAQVHIGDRYPIITGSFGGGFGGLGGLAAPPNIQFEDLGLTLKVTPRIHNSDELSLDVESEFKVLTGETLNGIPVISNRKFTSKVRLRNGEYAIAAGLLSANEVRALKGIAGVARVPLIGPLLSKRDRTDTSGQTLLVLRPRLTARPPGEAALKGLWVGSEGRARSVVN